MFVEESTAVQVGERIPGRLVRTQRRGLVAVAVVFVFPIATPTACEVGLPAYHRIVAHSRRAVVQEIVLGVKLGRRAIENYRFTGELRDRTVNPYQAEVPLGAP